MSRPLLLFLHLLGAILLFGTYITAFTTKTLGERTRDPRILRHVYQVMNGVDRVVTPVSVVVLLASGFSLAVRAGIPILETGWLAWSLALFGVTGVLFIARALPIQRRLERMLADGEPNLVAYDRLARQWSGWAGASLLLTIVILYLMIHR